jgi:hypothetical protein
MSKSRSGGGSAKLTQEELDELFQINEFIAEAEEERKSLVDEIREAILDSGRLSLAEWRSLRERLRDIEELIPHIDLIIRLKER